MVDRSILGIVLALFLASPALAGPCSERIADLERTISVKAGEGAQTSTAPDAAKTPANVTSQNKGGTEGMEMLKQARELDKQGKESECMDIVAKVATTKAPLTNK